MLWIGGGQGAGNTTLSWRWAAVMGDLSGRTYLVTGANTGIGLATARALAMQGGRVYLACRSREKGEAAVTEIAAELKSGSAGGERAAGSEPAADGTGLVSFLPLDLADLASVRVWARSFLALGEPLHVLINNAGVAPGPRVRGLTRDGFELMFGVNHLGHLALTVGLLDCLMSSKARVVNVSSDAHYQARGIDFDALCGRTRSFIGMPEYAVSKLCNVLFSQELARRLHGTGVTTYALHPGMVASDIWRRVPWPVRPLMTRRMLTTEQGARTSLYCATSPDVATASGRYYEKCEEREPSPVATPELGKLLWEQSEAWVRP
jgi:retinol dehydrogenase-12